MRKIFEKLEEKGYRADKELVLNIFNELRNSMRHDEVVFISLPSLLLALLSLPGLRLESVAVILFVFPAAWILAMLRYVKTRTFFRRLTAIIGEDPMDDYDIETWINVIVYSLLWVPVVLLALRNIGML